MKAILLLFFIQFLILGMFCGQEFESLLKKHKEEELNTFISDLKTHHDFPYSNENINTYEKEDSEDLEKKEINLNENNLNGFNVMRPRLTKKLKPLSHKGYTLNMNLETFKAMVRLFLSIL